MSKKRFNRIGPEKALHSLVLVLLFMGSCSPQSEVSSTATSIKAPKVILIIGDGMDDQQITIGRLYLAGMNGRLSMDNLPYRGAVQIQSVDEDNPQLALYVSDSANTATSMATGGITSPTRISTSAGDDRKLATIMELAIASGFGTGIVSTAALTDATPASFAAHVNQRACQGPAEMVFTQRQAGIDTPIDCSRYLQANGGPGSISEQLADSGVGIILGGGRQYFDQPSEADASRTVIDQAIENGYQVISNPEELAELDADKKVLGLFAANNLPVRLRGTADAKAELIGKVNGLVQLPAPFSCEPNPDFIGMPGLAQMTTAALDHLDATRSFVLMIESASIDKQSHARRPCGSIGELEQLNEALDAALAYAERHPETLILVTADHSHAAQLVSPDGGFLQVNFASPGYFARINTPEGSVMGVNYATNDSPYVEYHTGAQIPIYGFGPAIESLPTFMHQTEIFQIMLNHLRLTN